MIMAVGCKLFIRSHIDIIAIYICVGKKGIGVDRAGQDNNLSIIIWLANKHQMAEIKGLNLCLKTGINNHHIVGIFSMAFGSHNIFRVAKAGGNSVAIY